MHVALFKFVIAGPTGSIVPFQFIANDGNLVVHPITLTELDEQGIAERYDIVVDFSRFRIGDKLHLVNVLKQTSGNKPDGGVSLADALRGDKSDPVLGAMLQFRVVGSVPSVDVPGCTLTTANSCRGNDKSMVPPTLTEQIPIVTPVRTRVVEFGRKGNGDSRDPSSGQCTPDCSEVVFSFPWTITVNGQTSHSMNANRVSMVYPKAGEIEHWTYINSGGGWDHPIHLHFEEGITMNRGGASFPATENLVRKDVWRLRPGGRVQFQVQFGEYGGSYVNHCHNTNARGLRPAHAHPAVDRRGGLAANRRDGNTKPDAGWRLLHHARNPARRRSRPAAGSLQPANGWWWRQLRQGLTLAKALIGGGAEAVTLRCSRLRRLECGFVWLVCWRLRPCSRAQYRRRRQAGEKSTCPTCPSSHRTAKLFYDDVIKDKIVVLSFIYTSCKDICPLATARLGEAQDRLDDRLGRDIFFYSIPNATFQSA